MRKRILFLSLYNADARGVRVLSGLLNRKGHESYIVFLKRFSDDTPISDRELELLFNLIKTLHIDIVGISILSSATFNIASLISVEITRRFNTKIIFGGIHPTLCPDESIQHCDMLCRGESEESVLELMAVLESDQNDFNIQNIWINSPNGIIKNGLRPLSPNLDNMPPPQYDNEKEFYIQDNRIVDFNPVVSASFSRGCPFNCTYCCNQAIKDVYRNNGRYIRVRSVKSAIKELLFIKSKFPALKNIWFFDEVFPHRKDYVEDFSTKYQKHIGIPFSCWFHAKLVKEENVALLKKAGLKRAVLGIQSGSEQIRTAVYGRTDTDKDILKAATILNKYRLECVYDLISDNPFETVSDKLKTLRLLRKIPAPYNIQQHSLVFFPKTRITEMALKKGFISPNQVAGKNDQSLFNFNKPRHTVYNVFWNKLYDMCGKGFFRKPYEAGKVKTK